MPSMGGRAPASAIVADVDDDDATTTETTSTTSSASRKRANTKANNANKSSKDRSASSSVASRRQEKERWDTRWFNVDGVRGHLGIRYGTQWSKLSREQLSQYSLNDLERFGHRFAIVATQKLREAALGLGVRARDVSHPQYYLLERIGKTRRAGLLQALLHSEASLHHHIRVLDNMGLMYVVFVDLIFFDLI